jgi:sporulation protein YlmC with PRC-barrel domain
MRLSELRDAKVRTLDGETLGRVHEVHVEDGRVVALTCGAGSFIERLTARKHGRRIPWECVRRFTRKEVVVVPDPPQRNVTKRSGPRSRQGTPRPSGRRSKR